ncbi:AQG_2a_G0050330.mRNA.1.CDS.1 [Saccharomyces cerevisiae]|nr:AQG_2a_G0050330.mRNA.1.CDS.1 [Saccharomyces cerevisiae]CAI4799114.1 ACA_G0050360.mRNA.1.CDS.1 [Saccharomyces cerevisiae]CAI5319497.1 CFF_HP2_G0044090.mRNA.1.CDS.1 [Saccharomyces cerevisiae]CAI6725820.1 CFF_HP2_G0044090.mRNA.1.CDS.1 [Saccharomyces cerevisiae]CAI6743485.1 CFF_HP1_G0046290.mRNA.1.CDS.1 [Saccharomyces cerevisiae]
MAPGLPGIAWEVNNNYFHDSGIGLCVFFPFKITVRHDDKDYYGAFTDEEARKKGMIPYSEISEEEIRAYTLGECYTTGHEYKPESSDNESPELIKTSSENTNVFEIVHQKDDEKHSFSTTQQVV